MAITSRQHPIVKVFRRVARGDARLALLDGWHLLSDALDAGLRIDTVAIDRARAGEHARALDHARGRGASVVEVSAAVMDALSPVRTPTGVAATVERSATSLAHLFQSSPALIVLATDMQDPGNVGAVIRAAEGGGATGIAFTGSSADPWSWKALRAAMGSTFRMPVLTEASPAVVVDALASANVELMAAVPHGGVPMHDADMRGAIAIMIGGEGAGLAPALIDAAHARVSIPMHGRVESLNVSVAAALLVYEARRQRMQQEVK